MDRDVKRAIDETMTVGQLRELLEQYDENMPVFFATGYGDYGRTIQALTITEEIASTTSQLRDSAYSHSKVAFIADSDEEGGAYCPQCEDEFVGMEKCPCCGTRMVAEDGEPWTGQSGDEILILQ
jgi:hypothetical protein